MCLFGANLYQSAVYSFYVFKYRHFGLVDRISKNFLKKLKDRPSTKRINVDRNAFCSIHLVRAHEMRQSSICDSFFFSFFLFIRLLSSKQQLFFFLFFKMPKMCTHCMSDIFIFLCCAAWLKCRSHCELEVGMFLNKVKRTIYTVKWRKKSSELTNDKILMDS